MYIFTLRQPWEVVAEGKGLPSGRLQKCADLSPLQLMASWVVVQFGLSQLFCAPVNTFLLVCRHSDFGRDTLKGRIVGSHDYISSRFLGDGRRFSWLHPFVLSRVWGLLPPHLFWTLVWSDLQLLPICWVGNVSLSSHVFHPWWRQVLFIPVSSAATPFVHFVHFHLVTCFSLLDLREVFLVFCLPAFSVSPGHCKHLLF